MLAKTCTTVVKFAVMSLFLAFLGSAAYAQVPAGPNRPAEVPEGYLITPAGYFHASCVRRLAEGETLLPDGVIRHVDGTLEKIAACEYPHYTARGEMVIAGANGGEPPKISHSWIEDIETENSTSYGEITATWIVPPAPTSNDGQTVFFFPGLEQFVGDLSILQPVLGWNADFGSAWGIASWNCCVMGTTVESSAASVNSGDTILGTIVSTCSAGTLTCSKWNITTNDVTSSKSVELANSPNSGQTFNWAFAAALEVYNVSQCSDYPSNGFINFTAVDLYDNSFNLIPSPAWGYSADASGLSPQCNYGGQIGTAEVTLDYGDLPPVITSASSTTFTVGTLGSFQVTATGVPAPTFSESGALPTGVMFSASGLLKGTPAAGTGGIYNFTISASNVVTTATQSFTLTVGQAPAITSANHTTFTVGTFGSFAVTATGFPAPTFTESGALPSGVAFTSLGVLLGTPAAGTGGIYTFTIIASNGVGPSATQSFTLTVDQPPAITSGNSKTFIIGIASSFQVTATGFPTPTITESGALPGGITLSPSGLLGVTAAAGTSGTYHITIIASNGVSPNATQSFTITVERASTACAIFTSSPLFIVGQPLTFTAYVTASPLVIGSPSGDVSFIDSTVSDEVLGKALLVGGAASIQAALTSPVKRQWILVEYPGDPSFKPCKSTAVVEDLE